MGKAENPPKAPFDDSLDGQRQKRIFDCTFAMIAKLVSADGIVTSDEKQAIGKFITNVLELDKARTDYAIYMFQYAKSSETTFAERAAQYQKLFPDNPQMREWMLDTMFRISAADGKCCPAEEGLINSAADIFNLDEATVRRIKARHVPEVNSHYDILGCGPDASLEEITACYQKLREESSPDKVQSLGLPQEFIVLARDRFDAIEVSYQYIVATRRKT